MNPNLGKEVAEAPLWISAIELDMRSAGVPGKQIISMVWLTDEPAKGSTWGPSLGIKEGLPEQRDCSFKAASFERMIFCKLWNESCCIL